MTDIFIFQKALPLMLFLSLSNGQIMLSVVGLRCVYGKEENWKLGNKQRYFIRVHFYSMTSLLIVYFTVHG